MLSAFILLTQCIVIIIVAKDITQDNTLGLLVM